ncbi:MAG: excinuclease ABC subunit A [Rhodobacterales bacterium]
MTRNAFYTFSALALAAFALTSAPAMAAPNGCPPGLANKSDHCQPPGQGKKVEKRQVDRHDDRRDDRHDMDRRRSDHQDNDRREYRYHKGERIDRDYTVIRDPRRYGLNPNHTYYRSGDEVFRVDKDSRKVLEIIGLAAAILR